MCDNCLQSFDSLIGLDEHRNRKRAGCRVVCLIPKSVKASSRSRSNRSSRSQSLPEDRSGFGGVDEDLARTAATQAVVSHPDFNVISEKPNLTSRYFLQIK